MSDGLIHIDSCEVCGSKTLEPALDLGKHPMCDDLVEVGNDRVCKEYPIEILYCPTCATAHQKYQVPKAELFPSNYHYRSRHTKDVLDGMQKLVKECEEQIGSLKGKKVVDIGCNDGSLLGFFRDAGAETYGIEPTGAAKEANANGHTVWEEFLTEEIAERFVSKFGKADVITFTNVFAHIEDLPAVLRALQTMMHEDTALVVENHYLGAVLDRRQFDTFYHEHPRTYSYQSFAYIADTLGRRIIRAEFPKRYGGNIRVIMQGKQTDAGHDQFAERKAIEDDFGPRLKKMQGEIETWKTRKAAEIDAAFNKYGKLPAKAFPGRSAIPVKLLGLDADTIERVYEKPTSAKVGHYVPGTRIVIASDDDFDPANHDGPILNLAWHIGAEIEGYMRGRGFKGEFINIISPSDFE